jgi:hypothetical protein
MKLNFGSLKKPQIRAVTAIGVVGGVALSASISAVVDSVLAKGVYVEVAPGPFKIVKLRQTIIPQEGGVTKRSIYAGLWGTIPTEITAGVIYFTGKDNQTAKDAAIGLAVGGGLNMIGWLIKGLIIKK